MQVVAGAIGFQGIAGCPGGSTYGRSKQLAGHSTIDAPQVGKLNPVGNLELSAALVPENAPLELTIAGKQAYIFHGEVEGVESWYATSRICTHMRCNVDFNAKAQEYHCPCHRSRFALDGTVLKRPAKHDLQSWEVVVQGDMLEIILGQEQG